MTARDNELTYLNYLGGLYSDQKSCLNTNSKFARISDEDFAKIDAIRNLIINRRQITKEHYTADCTQKTGLPVWVQCSPYYSELSNNMHDILPEDQNNYVETAFEIGDATKRGTDLAEDTLSTFRVAGLLQKIHEPLMRAVIGGLNLLNLTFEFVKSIYDFIKACLSDDEFRHEHLTEAGLRASFASLGIATCILYLAGVLILPFALIGISAATLPIFIVTLVKNTYLYFKAKEKNTESSLLIFAEECTELERKKNLTPAEAYQLKTMQHRILHDHDAFLDAENKMSFAAIEMLAYLFVAAGSVLSLAMFFNPVILPVASTAALAVTIIGVGITTLAKIFQLVDDYYDHMFTRYLRDLSDTFIQYISDLFASKENASVHEARLVVETPKNSSNSNSSDEEKSSTHTYVLQNAPDDASITRTIPEPRSSEKIMMRPSIKPPSDKWSTSQHSSFHHPVSQFNLGCSSPKVVINI